MTGTVLATVDGTLVDSNHQHVVCWFRGLARRHREHRVAGYDDLGMPHADLSRQPFSKVS